jgi:cell division protein ZapE
LYTNGTLANEFHRTVSRIVEMQSRVYMDREQRRSAEALA